MSQFQVSLMSTPTAMLLSRCPSAQHQPGVLIECYTAFTSYSRYEVTDLESLRLYSVANACSVSRLRVAQDIIRSDVTRAFLTPLNLTVLDLHIF